MALIDDYTLDGFQDLLTRFGEEVRNGKYKPLPYDKFRILKKDPNRKQLHTLNPHPQVYIRTKNTLGGDTMLWSGKRGDGSFADFLFDYYELDKGEDKKMDKYGSSTTNDYYTNTITTTNKIAKDFASAPLTVDYTLDNTAPTVVCYNTTNLTQRLDKIEETIQDMKDERENKMDTSKMMNFDFGPVDSSIRMSPYGMAIKNAAGNYVSYDKTTGNIVNVEVLNFDGSQFMYKMPVTIKDIAVGDIVIHNRKPCFVVVPSDKGKVDVIDIFSGEEKIILPTRSMFGFDFVTKVVSFVDFGTASADAPFGNMLPFMLMQDDNDMKPFVLMSMMSQGSFDMSKNPMMMFFLMQDQNKLSMDMKDMMMMMFLSQQMNQTPAAPANQ